MKEHKEEIARLVKEKLVSVQKHPEADLFIYNYNPVVQYDRLWTPLIKQCRGLILDKDYKLIASPFPKFYNWEEHIQEGSKLEPIPDENFLVMGKMDGSLGILYWIKDIPYIATRGSFTSDQAKFATHLLHTKYLHTWSNLRSIRDFGATPLFEILYPKNRIVVDYEDKEELVLLAIKDHYKQNYYYHAIWTTDYGFSVVEKYDGVKDYTTLKNLATDNAEGFVIRFQSGFMMKIKFEEYVRLHKLLTQTSSKVIWEFLKEKRDLNELLDRIPDEFYNWVKKTKEGLEKEYSAIEEASKNAFSKISKLIPALTDFKESRKLWAMHIMKDYKNYSSIIFNLLDNKDYSNTIWKMIKPEYSKPFKEDE